MDLQCILCVANSIFAVKTPKTKLLPIHIGLFTKIENLDMFPSNREILRSNGRTGDNLSKLESPVQNSKPDQSFSICHWNHNSIAAHNFSKIQSLIAYNCIHHYDIICRSETYLNSDISSDNENLDIPDYRLIQCDHPSNDKRSGVCVYFKSSLPIQILSISMLHECINLEIRIYDKLCNLICLYKSTSKNMEEFETFLKNFELNPKLIFTKYPYLTVVIGDFNFKSYNWYKGDKTTANGTKLEIITSHYGLTQIINKPTHILEDASTCIDLIFTSQPNMVMDSGVQSSLHPNSHH